MGEEQRRAPRITRPFMIRYRRESEAAWLVSPLRDLSSGGARFFSERPFEVGALLEAQLALPVSAQPIAVNVKVAWAKPAPLNMVEVGVTFDPGDTMLQQTIDAAVAHFLSRKDKPR